LRMALRKTLGVSVLILFLALLAPGMASSTHAMAAPDVGRSVPIPIKVVLVGFDERQIDTAYLTWSGSGKNLPLSVTNLVLDSGNDTGVVFRPKYTFSLASSSFKQDLVSYLRSIEKDLNGTNPWFGQYQVDKENPDYYVSVPLAIEYAVYDANSVEDWLWSRGDDLGGYPEDGWTIILAYLPELPSASWSDIKAFKSTNGGVLPKSKPHYYGISPTDADLGYKLRYRDFMNAWGGHHRMWFVDLSAGPVFASEWEDLPLQVVLGDNNIDLSTGFGRNWLTEYMADYIWQATYNLIVPNFVYYPQYSSKYQVDIVILDDRDSAEKREVAIQDTVNKDIVAAALRDLVPYSTIAVDLCFKEVDGDLHQLIEANYKYTDSWILGNIFASPQRYGVVDVRPIYKYVLNNSAAFESKPRTTQNATTIPVFAFAFGNQTYFTYTYKWSIGKMDWETGALLGVTFQDAIFISFNQWEFTRGDHVEPRQPGKGEGFTETIIHEIGHALGLTHPHQYGNIGDFIFSPMGYFTNDYKFGQIDKDALQRAHVDQIYIETERLLNQLGGGSDTAGLVSKARSKLAEADSAYVKMDYAGAIEPVLTAYQLAQQATQIGPPPVVRAELTIVYFAGGIVLGVVLGLAIGFALMRRKQVT